jgi:hypothetical protein
MARKRSQAARIIGFFRDQPLEVAEQILGIVNEEVKARRPSRPKTAKTARKPAVPVVAAPVAPVGVE